MSLNLPEPLTLPGHITRGKNQHRFSALTAQFASTDKTLAPVFFDNSWLFTDSKIQRTQQPENTLSVRAISFIIPSLFILWSWTEWLKSQSERWQMKCFPPPSEREEPNSKNCGYFVYRAYSTRKICVATDANWIFKMIHGTNMGVFSTTH